MYSRRMISITALCIAFLLVLIFARSARAQNYPVCILKAGPDYSSGTPCTDAVNAYDGTRTHIHFDSCSSPEPYSFVVVLENDPNYKKHVWGFQVSVQYDPAVFSNPSCVLDPQNFFMDSLVSPECPALFQTYYYVYGAEVNMFNDLYPTSNPNPILIRFSFPDLNLSMGESTPLKFYYQAADAARFTKVHDENGNLVTNRYEAIVTCGSPPRIDPPTAVTLTPGTDGTSVMVTWNPSLNENGIEADADEYQIYRGSSCENAQMIGKTLLGITPNKTEYNDSELEQGQTYYYYVKGKAGDLESDASECVNITLNPAATHGVMGVLTQLQRGAEPVPDTGFPSVGVPGVMVQLMNGDTVIAEAVTTADGDFLLPVYEDSTDKEYTVRLVVTEESGMLAAPGSMIGGTGWRLLAEDITVGDAFTEITAPQLGAGPSIGDTDCNGYVDVQDFLEFKKCFGGNFGEEKYTLDCDMDGNAAIDVMDFLVLKKNFGLIGQAPPPGTCAD